MLPTLHVWDLEVSTYAVSVMVGLLACWAFGLARLRAQTHVGSARILRFFLVAFPIGVLGARVVALSVEHLSAWFQSLDSPGFDTGLTVLGAPLACILYVRIASRTMLRMHYLAVLDSIAFTFPLATFFGRLGCAALGCCFGSPTAPTSLFAIEVQRYEASTAAGVFLQANPSVEAIHAFPFYLACGAMLTLALTEFTYRRHARIGSGATFGVALIGDGAFRYAIERFRGGPWDFSTVEVNPWPRASVTISLALLVGLAIAAYRNQPRPSTKAS